MKDESGPAPESRWSPAGRKPGKQKGGGGREGSGQGQQTDHAGPR